MEGDTQTMPTNEEETQAPAAPAEGEAKPEAAEPTDAQATEGESSEM